MKIFLSGGESYNEAIKKTRHQHIFTSFYYAQGASNRIKTLGPTKEIIVDSGAHTFFSSHLEDSASIVKKENKSVRASVENLDNYVDEYIRFIKAHRHLVSYFVELDIDRVVGYEKVLQIRKKLYEATKGKLMVCYHPSQGTWEENKKDLLQYEYVGLEGVTARGGIKFDYKKIVKDCYFNKVKVHGFAMTKKNFLNSIPVYSTDSSSWLATLRFGRSAIRAKDLHDKQIKHEKYLVRDKIKRELVIKKEIEAWHKMEKYYNDLWISRGVDWEKQLYGN